MAKDAKRGRLSSIDLLPEEARPHVIAAMEALKERRRQQDDIREELNSHLLAMGQKPISRSAFHRKALWLATYGEQLTQAREVAAILAEKLNEAPQGDVGLLLNETIKTIVYDVIMEQSLNDSSASMEMLKEAALTLFRLEQARKISVVTRKRIVDDFSDKATKAIDVAAGRAGLAPEVVSQIRREVLGVIDRK
ncbi:DUF3486 family protein [Taklimakanibacter albus]|uniref:DUF3486 family protein n=1 Tax=Taklimakanibacter albus TaxID=2800327 RepID=A0ACC5R6L2_9HYPH|nr:DUF3486 family protein [Aestuariivirga sp. YIM B02566]MBK1868267.1 DUF3486 family protein [Aestuariivirga sp. YIM B02566]